MLAVYLTAKPTYRSTMAPPAPPFSRPGDSATPSLPSAGSHNLWPPSKGFWVGVAFFIIVMVSVVVTYSYFASPYWFLRLKALLGIRPSKRTPISRCPIWGLDDSETWITRPQPAYLSSKETLPVYEPATNFSNEVLVAILNLDVPPGARPPSYRSRLTWDWESIGEGWRQNQHRSERAEQADNRRRMPTMVIKQSSRSMAQGI